MQKQIMNCIISCAERITWGFIWAPLTPTGPASPKARQGLPLSLCCKTNFHFPVTSTGFAALKALRALIEALPEFLGCCGLMLFLQVILAGTALPYLLHGKSFLYSVADYDRKLNSNTSKIFLHQWVDWGTLLLKNPSFFCPKV